MLMLIAPAATGELGSLEAEQRLNLTCSEDGLCSLLNIIAGETSISVQETSAFPGNPKTVILQFPMLPSQEKLALLPDQLASLIIDLDIEEDPGSFVHPNLEVTLILGQNVNQWVIDGRQGNLFSEPDPYELKDEQLDLREGRMLRPGERVELQLRFTLEHPATWTLNLAGDSFLSLEVPWSIDPAAANTDEPSERLQPRVVDSVDAVYHGALDGDDVDCWSLELPSHEVFRIQMLWHAVPIEIEQPHTAPELYSNGIKRSSPDTRTTLDGDEITSLHSWNDIEQGEATLCWTGSSDRFQQYSWTAALTFEIIGPVTSAGFSGEAVYREGAGRVSGGQSVVLQGSGVGLLLFSIVAIFANIAAFSMLTSSVWMKRFALPISLVALLIGGIAHPLVSLNQSAVAEDEMSFEDWVDWRLEQIWQASHPAIDGDDRMRIVGSSLGVVEGARLQLWLDVDDATQLDDGRWMLHIEALDDFRIDRAVFAFLDSVGTDVIQGQGDAQVVNFALDAGRSLVLDLLLLESLQVVDELPAGSVSHIDWTFTSASPHGSASKPAWSTRPSSIAAEDWERLQRALFPSTLAVSYCDCGIAELEVNWPSPDIESSHIPDSGVIAASGLFDGAGWLVLASVGSLLLIAAVEPRRRRNARRLAVTHFAGYTGEQDEAWD